MSLAIMELAEEDKLARIESKWFNSPGACVSGSNGGADARLGLRRFSGLFLINAIVSCLMLLIHLVKCFSQERARGDQLAGDAAAGGALPWLHVWLRRFERRRGEPVGDGQGAAEPNRLDVLADGGVDQQGAMEDSHSTPVDAADSGRNAASASVSGETLTPVEGSSIGQSVHEPTARLDVHGNAAQALV